MKDLGRCLWSIVFGVWDHRRSPRRWESTNDSEGPQSDRYLARSLSTLHRSPWTHCIETCIEVRMPCLQSQRPCRRWRTEKEKSPLMSEIEKDRGGLVKLDEEGLTWRVEIAMEVSPSRSSGFLWNWSTSNFRKPVSALDSSDGQQKAPSYVIWSLRYRPNCHDSLQRMLLMSLLCSVAVSSAST